MITLLAHISCKRHPRYKGLRAPRTCTDCWRVWWILAYVQKLSSNYEIKYE